MENAPNVFENTSEKSLENGGVINCQTPSGIVAKEAFVYRQDVVRCKKFGELHGIVMEVAGDSDSDGSITDDSDIEDGEEDKGGEEGKSGSNGGGDDNGNTNGDYGNDSLPDGEVRITWINGSETTEDINSITVIDRSFLHGDIVASASDPTGQLGLVVDVHITVDLQAANGDIIRGVSSGDLKCIREFTVGDFVVSGPWLGRVDEVLDNVTVLFDDGSVCKVVRADPLRLKPVSKPLSDDTSCPYYPGQRVKAVSSSVFKTSRWLSGLWKANRLEGTVTKVETAAVVVYWIASAYLGMGRTQSSVPPEEQNPKNLTLISCFSYANWQLADWCLLPSPPPQPSLYADETEQKESVEIHTNASIVGAELSEGICEPGLKIPNEADGPHNVVISDPQNVQSDSEHAAGDFCENSDVGKEIKGSSKSQDSDTTVLNKVSKLGENDGTETSDLPECCSCSSASLVSKEPNHENWPTYRKKLRKVFFKRDKRTRRRDESFERALSIVNTVTKVDVAWQDGTRECGLSSTSLIPIHSPNDHEFFPEQYVVDKTSNEVDDPSETKRVGIVRSVNAKDRTVCVSWLRLASRPEDPREFDGDEVVSAYELDGHPDYDYCYGDVVVRLPSSGSDNIENPVGKSEEQADSVEAEVNATKNGLDVGVPEQVPEDESCSNFTSLSWVGNIVGFQDGDIEVVWGDGMMAKVGPHEVYVVGREDDGDSFEGGSEVSDDGASWETVDDNDMDKLDVSTKEGSTQNTQNSTDDNAERENNDGAVPEDNTGRNGPLSMPFAAIGYVTRLATEFFGRGRKQLDASSADGINENEAESDEAPEVSEKAVNEETSIEASEACDDGAHVNETAEEKSHATVMESAPAITKDILDRVDSNDDFCFKHFDIVQNPSDHHFAAADGQSTGGRKWVKKVQQEWNILEKNLPDDIYVRVFEERMDLIRAVIVGASGTPYQDGLFFFDFHLPPEYPQVPPSAYYHSGGLRVNPNLYVDGKVCLSLLNTWTGKGNEVWDPLSSSILQVLVSLQGLVLNSKPYFNEAGYEKQVGTVEGEKNSLPYNENTYLLNLKSMLYIMRRPPLHFEDFVKDHFRRRGHYILKACKAYLEGSLIGSLTADACTSEKSKEHSCSVGFKLTLGKICHD
uniref:E2 ubiquitin-conjugating enzyme n=1 Tax=Ananas comosus var. bracteatus TaxID=296719 RepID=A0A6V7PX97_ANACO|nr:unnamed protein product [Ananas comosus var. bracteatus]